MELTQNPSVLELVQKTAELTTPKEIVWIDGSEAQLESLRKIAVETGELIKLNEEKLPGCYLNRSDVNDVARVEGRTFICSRTREEAGPTNNWMDPDEMKAKLHEILHGAMAGRTMYVIPYSMGVDRLPVCQVRHRGHGLDLRRAEHGHHDPHRHEGARRARRQPATSSAACTPRRRSIAENRYIVHFPEENTIISVNSGYGGNVLLGKKCFALRIASVLGRKTRAGWQSTCSSSASRTPRAKCSISDARVPVRLRQDQPRHAHSARGLPQEGLQGAGRVGDDIAWLRIGPDGRLWAVNPENGFFGVAPGTNEKSNPNALRIHAARTPSSPTSCTTWTTTPSGGKAWTRIRPRTRSNWKGEPWDGSRRHASGAHPEQPLHRSGEELPVHQPASLTIRKGVPISAIVFGGRRAKTAPLVYQSRDWQHGVFVGSIMASETTAAATGAVGVVRRDPMAMLPVLRLQHGRLLAALARHGREAAATTHRRSSTSTGSAPTTNGHFMWPGFGDNMRVLEWILKRCYDEVGADETAIGYEPKPEDIDLDGSGVTVETLKELLTLDAKSWRENCAGIREYFEQFGDKLPHELREELEALEKAFAE